MAFNLRKFVGTIAPTLATALGGPLAGFAVKEIGAALGVESPTEDTIGAALQNATPDMIVKVKQLDQDFASKMKQMDIDLKKLEAEDTASARSMFIQTKARTPAALSWIVIVATLVIYGYLIMGDYDKLTVSDLVLGRVLGTLDMAFGLVLTFWLGSAHAEARQRSSDDARK